MIELISLLALNDSLIFTGLRIVFLLKLKNS